MATKMQRAFARSRIMREAMRDVLNSEGLPLRTSDALLTEICKAIIEPLPEPRIKEMLFSCIITDPGSTPAEQIEARQILRESETTLTENQAQELKRQFNI